jgi:hypothetical protein
LRILSMTIGAVLLVSAALAQKSPQPTTTKGEFFDKQVWPILKAKCVPCHGGTNPSGNLNLTDRAAILKGGLSGPSVDLKRHTDSLLLKAVRYEGRKMPPQGKLPQAQIETLSKWVAQGMEWGKSGDEAKNAHHGPPPVNAETMKFWSFQPVKRPAVPNTKNQKPETKNQNPIDAFILAKLEKNGLTPAPFAGRATLLRRAYYDVIGLPPSPDDVKAFVADKSPNAWEKVVDKLLASPQYGERWGRHWLDLVRYAETNSFERDGDKPFVWRYRDYVIRSFNEDKPYDRFIIEQLAGDELPDATPETLIATGYMRLGAWDDEPSDPPQAFWDDLDDILSTTSQTFLGLTVGCARCHDHKIDPIPQKDYYRMASFFQNINRFGIRGEDTVERFSLRPISSPEEQRRFEEERRGYRAKLGEVERGVRAIEEIVRPDFENVEKQDFQSPQNRLLIVKRRVPRLISEAQYADYERLTKEKNALRAAPPKSLEMALCITERGRTAPKTNVLMRGSAHAPGDEVTPGYLSVLAPPEPTLPEMPPDAKTTGRRSVLAKWIASPTNPLTARVMANRIWQFHFGRGIVRTTSNFGFMGTPPTHPELLDYLASELVRSGWKMKPLHRMIMLSNAYKMSSAANPVALKKDPENDLFWRFDMRRLEAEEIRDSFLAANGTLNLKMYGPSILVKLPQEVLLGQSVPGQGWGESSPEEQARRSVYIKVKRSLAVPIIARFDGADTDATCPVRFTTTQPTQALGMMNSAFVNEQARIFAEFVKKNAGTDSAEQVRFALWRVLQRDPTQKEIQRGVKLMQTVQTEDKKNADEALAAFCLVALNLNEFIYLD